VRAAPRPIRLLDMRRGRVAIQSVMRLFVASLACGACASEHAEPSPADTDAEVPTSTTYENARQFLFVAPNGTGHACAETEPCTLEHAKRWLRA
jgi:hypothetical protein